jgi:AcrR family transcriptional regulator
MGSRARNRRGEGNRLRAEILDAASELLNETGDEQAVTLRALARRIGIAAPSIYAHFPDRQAILLAVVRSAFAELRDALSQADAAAGEDPVDRLRAVSMAYLDFAEARPHRYRVMFGGLWNSAEALQAAAITDAEAAELGQDAMEVLVVTLAACATAGRSTSTDPAQDAVALWVALHGLAHQRAVAPLFPWPAAIATDIVNRLGCLLPGVSAESIRAPARPRARGGGSSPPR